MRTHKFLAMWDMLGLESLIDYTKMEQEKLIDILKGDSASSLDINVAVMVMRATSNPQRHYEIYAFDSELQEDELKRMFKNDPQVIVDAIRSVGVAVYSNRANYKERVII